jgi:hypothetical protein
MRLLQVSYPPVQGLGWSTPHGNQSDYQHIEPLWVLYVLSSA